VGLFLSNFECKVDRTGRVSVPKPFRNALAPSSFDGLVLYQSEDPACLEGASYEFLENLADSLYSDKSPFDPSVMSVATTILAEAQQLTFDPEGRVRMSDDFRDYANIKDKALFFGLGKKFMIWNPEAYQAYRQSQRESARRDLLNVPSLDAGKRS